MLITTAIVFGFLGSMHCLGMCAPLLWAVPDRSRITPKWFINKLLYNLGRIITYATLGMLIGFLGEGLNFFGWQRYVSFITGGLLLVGLLLSYLSTKGILFTDSNARFTAWVRASLGKFMIKKGYGSHLTFGLLNGLLPCGLVYMALLASLSMNSIWGGALYMIVFGAGTFPAMLGAAVLGSSAKKFRLLNIKKLAPKFIAIVAILLILRGMNLGIPYLSPKLDTTDQVTMCQTS